MEVRNTSDVARVVPLPDGDTVQVEAGESFHTTNEHAAGFEDQDAWSVEGSASARGRARKAREQERSAANGEPTEATPQSDNEPDDAVASYIEEQ